MALTLAESAKLSQDTLAKGVLETFVQTSPILDRIPFMEIAGNAYAYDEEATLPGVAFRSVNEAYAESTGTVNQKSEKLVILGGDADVDRFIQQTRSNVNDQRAEQTALKVKAISYKFQETFFTGDSSVDTKSFDGLRKRLTGKQVIDAAANGMPILGSSNADIHQFLDKLDELLAAVPGINSANGAIYASAAIIRKIGSAMRHISYDTTCSRTSPANASCSGTASRSSRPARPRPARRSSTPPKPRAPPPTRPASTPSSSARAKATRA